MTHNDSFCIDLHRLFNKIEVDTGKDFNLTTSVDGTWQRDVITAAGNAAGSGRVVDGWSGDETGPGSDALNVFKFYLASVVHPALCVFGVVGNVFNVMVLSRGQIKATLECSMELAAHTGLVALAVSDILYCVSAFMVAVVSRHRTAFDTYGLELYIRLYAPYLQNVFLHTGTWLTVVMAVGRYAAICRPLQARHLVGVRPTGIAVLMTFVVWTLLDLPKIWTFDVVLVDWCSPPGTRFYVLDHGMFDHGMFVLQTNIKTAFTYVWAIVGFLLPVLLLSYCNVHLIRALRESIRVRRLYRVSPRTTSPGSRISPTLIAIVCMYLVLITPSELSHFYFYYAHGNDEGEIIGVTIVVTNVLQTLNFAVNFVLYCIVNVHFRRTCFDLVYRICHCCSRSTSMPSGYSSASPFGNARGNGAKRGSASSTALRCGSQNRLRLSWHSSSIGSNYLTREYCVAHIGGGRPAESEATGCETAL